MSDRTFDEHAEQYDIWFTKNPRVLESEVLLLKHFLVGAGKTLSVGCGSGLFESILAAEHGIDIQHGVEPSDGMRAIAVERGLSAKSGRAESIPFDAGEFETVLLNGTPGYIEDLETAFRESHRVLVPGGRIVVADVPAESSYGTLYQLAAHEGSWEGLRSLAPRDPYPAEFLGSAHWRTTGEIVALLGRVGFVDLEHAQTLLTHPKYSNETVQEPVPGYERGDYVATRGRRR